MSGNASKSYPGVAGGIETVTNTLIVDTGLTNVKHFTVTMAQAPSAGANEAFAAYGVLEAVVPGATRKLALFCVQDDATAATVAAAVSWSAQED